MCGEGMWEIMCGEGEREGGRGGEGERENMTSSKPLDKHSTPIDRHYKQDVLTEVSIRKVYWIRMDSLDVVSVYQSSEMTNLGKKTPVFCFKVPRSP
jgi:hypothetical protein